VRHAACLAFALLLAGCAATPPPIETITGKPIPDDQVKQTILTLALTEWANFGKQRVYQEDGVEVIKPVGVWEDDRKGSVLVAKYWKLLDPDSQLTGYDCEDPWSAVFISYVMRMAGAGNRFPYSETHSDYINAARRHGLGLEPGIAIAAERIEAYAPQRGDLVCYWRGRQPILYDELPAGRFAGHCDIVVGIRPSELEVIGGNVENAVAMRHIPATSDDHLAGPDGIVLDPDHPYFVVLRVEYLR